MKIIDEKMAELSDLELLQVERFKDQSEDVIEVSATHMTLAEKAKSNKRLKSSGQLSRRYFNLSYIPPTSNVVERLFSSARLVLTDYRKSMTDYTFECVMFLKLNSEKWNVDSVAKLLEK